MDSPETDLSSDSSDAHTAELTSAQLSPALVTSSADKIQTPTAMEVTTTLLENDDSASDVSMSADSEDDEDDSENSATVEGHPDRTSRDMGSWSPAGPAARTSRKRRISDAPSEHTHKAELDGYRKRFKDDFIAGNPGTTNRILPHDKSLLPAEIWHHIFSFCQPKALGLSLQVNRSFNACLDPLSSDNSRAPLTQSFAKILKPDDIWRASRKLFLPSMPSPLIGVSELDMWKLVCGSKCQFCCKENKIDPNVQVDQWHPGPGPHGIVPVYSFGLRSCGSCLNERSTKEIDLLLSSSIPSPLMAALPFIFFTNELHIIPITTLQNGQHPSSIQITKQFSIQQADGIKVEFESVKAMGSATAEEWLKGLETRGKERRNDIARWDRWEASGGLTKMRSLNTVTTSQIDDSLARVLQNNSFPPISTNGKVLGHHGHNTNHQTHYPTHHGSPFPSQTPKSNSHPAPPRFDSPAPNGFANHLPRPYPPQPKQERTKEEVAELKAVRRAEIERRCILLDPPLTASVLAHMASFQAAIQIIQPLNDGAWEVLKPRLLSQREEAEQRENHRLAQTRVVQERSDERKTQDSQTRSDSKDLVDREWDDMQAPLRARIGGYADEIIRDGWNGGEKVTSENCPLFAAEVLIYIRKRFYAEVAKDEAALRATGREQETNASIGPYANKLILENMKWVFDTKVKPRTEPHRKELFLCNACEYASKYYGFEGVIQHYAAKHTSALSMGSIVVHWKSEWPEHPPFNPDPTSVKPYYGPVPSTSAPYAGTAPVPLQQNYGYGGYQPAAVSAPMPVPNTHIYQESPGPYYGHPQFGDQYTSHQSGPYAPPILQQYPDVSQGYQAVQYSAAPNTHTGYSDAQMDYPQQVFSGPYSGSIHDSYTSPHQGQLYPGPACDMTSQQASYTPQGGHYSQPHSHTAPSAGTYAQTPSHMTEEYKTQLQEAARSAREIWNSIHGIKEVPGSVKVYTIIHHLLKRFRATFGNDPPLSLIVDGLSNNKDMRPVRNVNGLVCKACTLDLPGSMPSTSQKKHFSFPQLVNHFYQVHEQGVTQSGGQVPDWTKYIVELPDNAKLESVATAPGMDDQMLKLFTEALPEILSPLESDPLDIHRISDRSYTNLQNPETFHELVASQDSHEKYYTTVEKSTRSPAIPYDSGEYDPRNPRDLPADPGPLHKPSRRNGYHQNPDFNGRPQSSYRYSGQDEDEQYADYQERPESSYVERRPISRLTQSRNMSEHGRVIVQSEEEPFYIERPIRYRDSNDFNLRIRHERPVKYRDRDVPHDYGHENTESYEMNRQNLQPPPAYVKSSREGQLISSEDAAAQQSRIFEVVAQISKQAKQTRGRQAARSQHADAGSEDGELRIEPGSNPESERNLPIDEASNAAERFLNELIPNGPPEFTKKEGIIERRREEAPRAIWENDRGSDFEPPEDPGRRMRRGYEEGIRIFSSTGRPHNEESFNSDQVVHERVHSRRHPRPYAYEDNFVNSAHRPPYPPERSPELVDRRFKLNNVVYRDDRQSSVGYHRTPGRYARYESVRLENERARSRSPLYVKMGPQHEHYRERSPGAHPLHQESIYRTRTPQTVTEEASYERAPRQEVTFERAPRPQYYRVYADESRLGEPQYAEAFEYVRVSDPQGDYMIRRPKARQETGSVYAEFEDEAYSPNPVYDTRRQVSRPDPSLYEEYDPRHPEPPTSVAPVRKVRYE